MNAESYTSLEQRLDSLAAELEHVRSKLRTLQAQRRPLRLWERIGCFSGLALLGVIVVGASTHVGIAQMRLKNKGNVQTTKNNSTGTATVLNAPVEIRGKSGQTIARFSEDSGHYGLEVDGPGLGKVVLGFNSDGGAIFLKNGGIVTATMKGTGFTVWNFPSVTPYPISYLGKSNKGTGFVAVYNGAGTQAGFLLAKDDGGGNVTVANPLGEGVFSAGYTDDGGNACVANVKRGVTCVGIGLPMTFSVQK